MSNYALRFNYAPNNAGNGDSWAEQELSLNSPQRELWVKFRLRIADNYTHRNSSPSNNKLLAIFMDGYSSKGDGPTVIWEMWADGNGGSRAAVHYSWGGHNTANAHRQHTPFISTQDRGRWMTIVFRVVAASSRGADNGIIQMWRRWEGELQWRKIHELLDADIAVPPGGPNGWKTMKILGWANSGFDRTTYMYVDDIEVADASLLTSPTVPDQGGGEGELAYDSFESGNLSYTTPRGFRWYGGTGGMTVSSTHFRSGARSLLFPYRGGKHAFQEQRFAIGGVHPDVWFRYWLRVPSNWTHGGGNTNNKFFALWMDQYERVGPTGVIQLRNTNNGDSRLSPYMRSRSNYHPGEQNPGFTLIRSPADRGRWMEVVIRAKMADSASAANGRFEMWRRWEGQNNWETCFSYSSWNNYHVNRNRGWAHGYLMGWFNATQPAATNWYIDNFTVSDSSLL